MGDSTLVFENAAADGLEYVVNFGVHAGRDVTRAEIDRLGQALLDRVETFAVVSEQRFGFDRHGEASVHQVRVELPPDADTELVGRMIEDWARDCIRERSVLA